MPQDIFERQGGAHVAALVGQAKQRHQSEVGNFGKPIDAMTDAEVRAAFERTHATGGPIGDFLAGQARSIDGLLELAETAPPIEVRWAGGDRENPRVTPAAPPTAAIRLSRELMPAANIPELTGVNYTGLQPDQVGEVVPLRAQLMRESVFASMGGNIILDEPVPLALKETAGRESRDVFVERPRQLRVITPLQFTEQVADGAPYVSPWPAVSSDAVDGLTSAMPGSAFMTTYLTRVRLTRRQQAMLPKSLWALELAVALAAGVARLADSVAFKRLEGFLTAAPFSLAAFAAKGVAHESLRAVIGTSAIGAQFRATDSRLTYANVCPAALTPTMDATLIGDWSRAAVFFRDDMTLVAKRESTSGDLDITAVASLRFECPDAGFFERVSA